MSVPLSGPAVSIPSGLVILEGVLELPQTPCGIVVFSHGSGSGRHSPRNRYVAQELREAGLATLLLDLLTPDEDRDYAIRFDIGLLTDRLGDAVRFVRREPTTRALRQRRAINGGPSRVCEIPLTVCQGFLRSAFGPWSSRW